MIFMCGIVGLINTDDVSRKLHTALFSMQHRGQDAAGILAFDGQNFHLKKGVGLIAGVFNEKELDNLKGNVGIGQVRYPTAGLAHEEDAQPFVINFPFGIGMAHNGNVTNSYKLKCELKEEHHRQLHSTCDAELMLNVFASELIQLLSKEKNIDEQIFDATFSFMKKVEGSYSTIALIAEKGLLAFRDPYGVKPLVFGVKEEEHGCSYMFASETVALDTLGYMLVKDLEPGEAIFINFNGVLRSKVLRQAKKAHCMFEWVYFARPDSVLEGKSVYDTRLKLGEELAKLWLENIGLNEFNKEEYVVIPAPDTSRPAAILFSEITGIRQREGLIKNRYIGRTFIMPDQKMRDGAVRIKMNPIVSEVKDKKVILIDDSIVRGTTSKKIVSMIRDAGAKEIHLVITCPPIRFPCFYGIDMATHGELIAFNKNLEQIAQELGVDSLIYQTIDGLRRAIGINDLCLACLNKEYPTELTEDNIDMLEKARTEERKVNGGA